jgi:putative transcriptional regulator
MKQYGKNRMLKPIACKILAEKEITNRWLAEQMGVTDMTVSRWKTNKVQPSMAQFVEIAQLLKVDIKDLIEADFNYDIE